MEIVLASSSPRRSELLRMLGLEFTVRPSDAEESIPDGLGPADAVMHLARTKNNVSGDVVISADTIVYYDGRILGKPKDAEEAAEMLRELSGRTHEVYTGICVNGNCGYEMTRVTFREISDREIHDYIMTGEPLDKAGAYGAQGKGALFVEKIEGDFFNVMGLPLCRLGIMLNSLGVEIL